jgi:hypothetical protein
MRMACFPFVMMTAAILLQGESLVGQTNSVPQRTIADNSDKSADDRSPAVQNDDGKVRSEEFHTRPAEAQGHKHSTVTRTQVKKRPITSKSLPTDSHRLLSSKTATKGSLRPNTAVGVVGLQMPDSRTGRVAPPNMLTKTRSVPVLPTAGINGHQFKNSHDPGTKLETAGGTLVTAGGTAALNGSNMKRKP